MMRRWFPSLICVAILLGTQSRASAEFVNPAPSVPSLGADDAALLAPFLAVTPSLPATAGCPAPEQEPKHPPGDRKSVV